MVDKSLMDSNRQNARRNAPGLLIKEPTDITYKRDERDELEDEINRSQNLNQSLAEQRAKIKGIQSQGTQNARINASEQNNYLMGQRALVGRYRDITQKLGNPKSIDICAEPETGYKEAQVAFRLTKSGATIDAEIKSAGVIAAGADFGTV